MRPAYLLGVLVVERSRPVLDLCSNQFDCLRALPRFAPPRLHAFLGRPKLSFGGIGFFLIHLAGKRLRRQLVGPSDQRREGLTGSLCAIARVGMLLVEI